MRFCAPFKPWSKLVRQGFGGLVDFFVSGANLIPGARGPATGQGPKSDGRHKIWNAFDGNDRRRYVSVRHLNPGANLCVKGLVVLWTFL